MKLASRLAKMFSTTLYVQFFRENLANHTAVLHSGRELTVEQSSAGNDFACYEKPMLDIRLSLPVAVELSTLHAALEIHRAGPKYLFFIFGKRPQAETDFD